MAVSENTGGDAGSTSLYEEFTKVYPREVKGTFRSLKTWTNIILLAIYFFGPWLRWDRGPDAPSQAILLDIAGRRGYIFNIEIWPQEVYYLTGVLILAAVGLFLATSLFGRIWCGFTCIQTVFTEIFVWVERLVEGDRTKRIKLDREPLSARKVFKKGLKNIIWLVIALATGFGFVLYFNDAPSLVVEAFTGQAGMGIYGFTALIAAFTYLLAGYAREQVCIYMCPWPRFQAAMVDEHSLIVTYEDWRGEPRGFARKGADFSNRGHCVDCGACVQTCPTGVDIRKGSQMGCIGCGLCIDACNNVMDRYGLPHGLISYDSYVNQNARAKGETVEVKKFIRPRTIIYAGLLLLVATVMVVTLATRSRLEISILHERSPLFVSLTDGSIRNGYTFKILNMEPHERSFDLRVDGIEGAHMRVIGYAEEETSQAELPVRADSVGTFRVYVAAPRSSLDRQTSDLRFSIVDRETGLEVHRTAPFAGPPR